MNVRTTSVTHPDSIGYICSIVHTVRFPPDLLMSTVSSIRTRWETALTMSYTVRAAMLAPVMASISTPVLCVTRHSHWMTATDDPAIVMSTFTESSGRGWHRGMSSLVRLWLRS
jgi:hypothetical protein